MRDQIERLTRMDDSTVSVPDIQSSQKAPAPNPKRGSFASDMLKLVSGTAFAQVVALIATPIITRLFSPDAFGVAAAFTSLVGIVQVFLLLRYDQAIVLPEDDRDAANVLGASVIIGVFISFLVFLILWLWRTQILELLNLTEMTGYLWILLPTLLVNVFTTVITAWATRKRLFGNLAGAQMVNALSTTGLRIGSGTLGANGAPALLVTNLLGNILALLYLGWRTLANASHLFRESIRWDGMIAQVRRYSDQPRYGTIAMILNSISWQLPVFLLTGFFSPAVAGQYALGQRVIRTPMSLVGTSIGQVFYTRAATARHDGTLAPLALNVFQRLVVFGLAPTLFLVLEARDLFAIVFGPEWQDAGSYVQILSLWSFVWFISSPISQLQMVLERQQFFLYWNIVNFTTRFVSLWFGAMRGSVELSMLLFGASGVIVYGYLTVYLMNAAGVRTISLARVVGKNILLYLPSVILSLSMQYLDANTLLRMLATGITIGLAFVYSIRNESVVQQYLQKLRFRRGGS